MIYTPTKIRIIIPTTIKIVSLIIKFWMTPAIKFIANIARNNHGVARFSDICNVEACVHTTLAGASLYRTRK